MKQWKAKLTNGQIVMENPPDEPSNWDSIRDQVVCFEFNNNGQTISLPKNCDKYIQGKTASGNISTGKCEIESRFFGFCRRNNIVKIRIDEKTNNISIEISS